MRLFLNRRYVTTALGALVLLLIGPLKMLGCGNDIGCIEYVNSRLLADYNFYPAYVGSIYLGYHFLGQYSPGYPFPPRPTAIDVWDDHTSVATRASSEGFQPAFASINDEFPRFPVALNLSASTHFIDKSFAGKLDPNVGFTILVKYYDSGPTAGPTTILSLLDSGDQSGTLFSIGRNGKSLTFGRHLPGRASNVDGGVAASSYWDTPWDPKSTVENTLDSTEFAYFTFTPDGKVRIDKFRPYAYAFFTAYNWQQTTLDGGYPKAGLPSDGSPTHVPSKPVFYTPGDLVLGAPLDELGHQSYSVAPSPAPGIIGYAVFSVPLSSDAIIAYQNSIVDASRWLAETGKPCNTGIWLPASSSTTYPSTFTPCGTVSPFSPPYYLDSSNNFVVPGPSDSQTVVSNSRQLKRLDGTPLHLRGVNLGGWLVRESWMSGERTQDPLKTGSCLVDFSNCINDFYGRERLEARFGAVPAQQLIDVWEQNYVTSSDLDSIVASGFNVVRVPFSWRTIQNADGSFHRLPDGSIDFGRLDWIVREAKARGLYVILDLHDWQSRRTNPATISQSGTAGDLARSQAADLWGAITSHFQGDPTIAAFDVLNEASGSVSDYVYYQMYAAIRTRDPLRMVIVESRCYADLNAQSWTNVIYSIHDYNLDGASSASVSTEISALNSNLSETLPGCTSNIPVEAPYFLGEFKVEPANVLQAVSGLNGAGWNWTPWTYSAVDQGNWALVNYPTPNTTAGSRLRSGRALLVDFANDPADAISQTWAQDLTPTVQVVNSALSNPYGSGAKDPCCF